MPSGSLSMSLSPSSSMLAPPSRREQLCVSCPHSAWSRLLCPRGPHRAGLGQGQAGDVPGPPAPFRSPGYRMHHPLWS